MSQPVVDGQRGSDQRPEHGMIRHGAGSCRVDEEARHIPQVLEEHVPVDGVEIVEVEFVLEMVGVRRQYRQQQRGTGKDPSPAG